MADTGETTFVFKANTKPAEDTLDEFGDKLKSKSKGFGDGFTSGLGKISVGLIALNQGIELFEKGLKLAEKAFDFAKHGEEITAISTRFNILAEQAGLVPEKLSKGIEQAIGGTVQLDDAMKVAQKSLIELGTNGERIPQVFELARKASQLMGGEITDRFQQISQAIATGATRSLRDIGIIIDSQKAYEKYASAVGRTVDQLSEAQKQQAMMNAVLQQGAEKFKNINGSITPLSESASKAKVSMLEFGDSLSLLFQKNYGSAIQKSLDWIDSKFKSLNRTIQTDFLGATLTAEEQMKKLTDRLTFLVDKANSGLPGAAEAMSGPIASVSKKIQELGASQEYQNEITKKSGDAALETAGKFDALGNSIKADKISLEELRMAQASYQELLSTMPTIDNFVAGFNEGMTSMAGSVKSLGKNVSATFVNGFSSAFSSVGKALVKGGNALDAFGKSMLSMLGTIAIQMGQFLMLAGLGFSLLPGGFSAAGAIAAGAGLMILGGVLQALGGGGETPAAGGGGGTTGADGTSTSGGNLFGVETPDAERAAPQTGVQVVVQGNVFDSKETGLQIANILNESFDTNGTIVRAFA